MDYTSWIVGSVIGATLLANLHLAPGSDLYEVDVLQLAEMWQRERISPVNPYSLRHADLKLRLKKLAGEFPEVLRLEEAGRSAEGREIYLVKAGSGSENILLWSQMHGDEPTATSSLLDLFVFLGRHRKDGWVADILRRYTLFCIPMLNPDGAERNQRRNVQGIDINRDARVLQTPEGRILKLMVDRYHPFLGFNLHNQIATTTVGDTGKVAAIALLAVASDRPVAAAVKKPGVPAQLARRVAGVLHEALSPFIQGHISRYDESFNPRAFGDNITLWGTPVVLIESGGVPAGKPSDLAVQLNFVGLLAVFNSLATGKVQAANTAIYDRLKPNSATPIYDLILSNGWIFNGTGIPLFRADIAIRRDNRAGAEGEAVIADIGDLGVLTAHETIDCSNALITPGLKWFGIQPIRQKAKLEGKLLAGLKRRSKGPVRRSPINVGAPADLVIWATKSNDAPPDLTQYRPRQIIVNGRPQNF
jgi:hypothetical protein